MVRLWWEWCCGEKKAPQQLIEALTGMNESKEADTADGSAIIAG
jgi:hypothetical protein